MSTAKATTTVHDMVDVAVDKATEAVQNRQGRYGHPKENFDRTAQLWSVYFGLRMKGIPEGTHLFASADVPALMILLKMAREMHGHDPDNLVDIAGYAKTWQMLYGEA